MFTCWMSAGVGVGDGVSVGCGDGVSVGCGDGVSVGCGDGVSVGCGDGVSVGCGDGVSVGAGEGVSVGPGDGVSVGDGEGVSVASATAPSTVIVICDDDRSIATMTAWRGGSPALSENGDAGICAARRRGPIASAMLPEPPGSVRSV